MDRGPRGGLVRSGAVGSRPAGLRSVRRPTLPRGGGPPTRAFCVCQADDTRSRDRMPREDRPSSASPENGESRSMRAYNWARIARGNPSCHARNLTAQRSLHAMQALFQLSYSPTRTRMLHEADGLACDPCWPAPRIGLAGPSPRPTTHDPWRPSALRFERGDDDDRMAGNPAAARWTARMHDPTIDAGAAAATDGGSAPRGCRDRARQGGTEPCAS